MGWGYDLFLRLPLILLGRIRSWHKGEKKTRTHYILFCENQKYTILMTTSFCTTLIGGMCKNECHSDSRLQTLNTDPPMVFKLFSRTRHSKLFLVLGLELYKLDIRDLISTDIGHLIHTRCCSKHRRWWVRAELPFPFYFCSRTRLKYFFTVVLKKIVDG